MKKIKKHRSPWTGGGGISSPAYAPRRTIKINDITSFLGDNTLENEHLQQAKDWNCNAVQFYGLNNINFLNAGQVAQLAAFIEKAFTQNYNIVHVGGIRDGMTGFQEMIDYNTAHPDANQQFNDFNFENEFWFGKKVVFTITSAVNGMTYRITLDGVNYDYIAGGGDTIATIRTGLYALIPTSPTVPATWTKSTISTNQIQIWADDVDVPFTNATAGNISTSVINMSRAAWLDEMDLLKAALVASLQSWETSAYVQNYSGDPRWGSAAAARMIQSIDVYEGTNYTVSPDPDQLIESQLYLLADALAANPGVKIRQRFQKLLSAEPAYLHNYLSTNGILATETTWNQGYQAYGSSAPYTNSVRMTNLGACYFAYNQMKAAPAIIY